MDFLAKSMLYLIGLAMVVLFVWQAIAIFKDHAREQREIAEAEAQAARLEAERLERERAASRVRRR